MYHKRKVFLQLLSFAVKTTSQASKQVRRQDKQSEANCLVSGKDGIEKQGKQDQLPNICFDGDILPHLGFSPGRPSHEGSCLKKPMPRLPGSSAATSCVCPDAAPWVAKQILLSCSSLAASCHCQKLLGSPGGISGRDTQGEAVCCLLCEWGTTDAFLAPDQVFEPWLGLDNPTSVQ